MNKQWVLRRHITSGTRVKEGFVVTVGEGEKDKGAGEEIVWFEGQEMPEAVRDLQRALTRAAPAILAAILGE